MGSNYQKKYSDPAGMDSTEFSAEEISSHSSLLTNQRLNNLFGLVDIAAVEARTNPCIPTIQDYQAGLMGIYNIVWPIFEPDENEDMANKMGEIILAVKNFHDNTTANEVFDVVLKLDSLYRLIVGHLQIRNYFFRLRLKNVKGIKQAIKILEDKIEKGEVDEDE